jgi:pilus assembly protein CpaF
MYDLSKIPIWNKCLNLLYDPQVSEIEANGPNEFFCKRSSKRVKLDLSFDGDEKAYLEGIEQGLVPHVRSSWPYERNSYIFEGPLYVTNEDGDLLRGRCHIVLPPAVDYPQVTIAKKSTSLVTLESIAARGSMSTEMLLFLADAIRADLTIVFSGGTGAGKTTMLEAMTKLIPPTVRIGVAEDAPELDLIQPNVSYLHSVPWQPGLDPNKVATLSWCVQQFQRMRTDRLIIGETRGAEFSDFLIAANSGMEGSMTTLHANEPTTALDKMSNFAMRAGNGAPLRSINQDIANSVDLIIQLIIRADGSHRMSHIQEITKTVGANESARIATASLYLYDKVKDDWIKEAMPTDDLRRRFEHKGIDLSPFLSAPIGSRAGGHSSLDSEENLSMESGIPPKGVGLPTNLPTGTRRL